MSKIVDILTNAFQYAINGDSFKTIKDELQKLDEVEVMIYREDDFVKLPTYAKSGDACMDVYVNSIEPKKDGRVIYHTGLYFALPEDYEMEIRPRSSNTKTYAVMQNSPGTLDEGYRGELTIVHRNLDWLDDSIPEYSVGDRVAQILIRRRERIIWNEVRTKEELGNTERGDGGYGSSGR